MLRVHLSSTDLARLVFQSVPHLDVAASLQLLRTSVPVTGFPGQWRRRALAALPEQAAPLLDLVPVDGPLPDRLTAFRPLIESGSTPPDLATAYRSYERHCLSPMRTAAATLRWRELARLRLLADRDGPGAALSRLAPGIAWHDGILEIETATDGDVDPHGRGLQVIPGLFWRRPGVRVAGLPRPALVYPMTAPVDHQVDPLARLLGATRARVLRAVVTEPSTSRLARLTGISPASASEHARVLREAGLAVTDRYGQEVRHRLTPMGLALAAGGTK